MYYNPFFSGNSLAKLSNLTKDGLNYVLACVALYLKKEKLPDCVMPNDSNMKS